MNICYISSIDISLPNGPGVNEREFLNTLQKEAIRRDDRVSCLIPMPSGRVDISMENMFFYKKQAKDGHLTHGGLIANVIKIVVSILANISTGTNMLYIVRLSSETLAVPLILRLLRKPYYLKTLEDVYGFAAGPTLGLTRFNYLIKRILLGFVLPKAIFIDASTQQLVDTYKDRFRIENIIHIDNAVNTERYDVRDREESKTKCGLQSFRKIVGYCGGFPSQRGAGQLIGIARRLSQTFPDCGILIIGDDAKLETLKLKVRRENMQKYVKFKGIVPYEKLVDYVNCLDVGIALDTTQRVNSYGNSSQKIRQYLACGIPVICPHNTNHEIVDHRLALSVPINDLDSIFDTIDYLFSLAPQEIRQYQIKARQYAINNLSTDVAYEKRYRLWEKFVNLNVAKA